MWEKSKRVLVSGVLSLSLIGSTTVLAAVNDPTHTQINENTARNYLKVSYEGEILFHEQVPTKTMIQVLNGNNDVIESNVLTSDKEMNLGEPKVNDGKMLSYWSIEMANEKLLIKPILTNKEEYAVKFYVKDSGGNLLENHEQIKEIVKSATRNTKLKDVLPNVNPNPNYKFSGWFETVNNKEEKLQGIDDRKITNSKGEYYAKFYSDFNDNNIDDKTEEITVNFETNIEGKIDPIKLNVGQKVKAPKLSSKDKIFIGWYTNKELTNKFANDNLKGSITLYAKWENAEKVINESEKKPITDKDVSDQVEKLLNDLKNKQTLNEKPDTNNTKDNTKANNSNVTPSTSNPAGTVGSWTQNNSGIKDNAALNANKVNVYNGTKYVIKNKNVGEIYMVKFYDENGAFVSSLALPYGRTIKLLDEKENLHEEYAVRQDTSINLNKADYVVNKDSTFLGLETRTVDVNASEITEIYPKIAKRNNASSFLYKNGEKDNQKKNSEIQIWIITLSVIAVFCIILATLLFLKKRKKKEQDQGQNINI
uniref:InlB B-repeat-containing protein n=1 Tax=Bacillus cytotoxicus TaxID=580165 RepID=UPI00203AD0BE